MNSNWNYSNQHYRLFKATVVFLLCNFAVVVAGPSGTDILADFGMPPYKTGSVATIVGAISTFTAYNAPKWSQLL